MRLAPWLVITIFAALPAHAARDPSRGERDLELSVGGSLVQRITSSIDKVIIGDPTICDVVALPPSQLLITGKAPGETLLTVWSRDAGASTFHISVNLPVANLLQSFRETFPAEEELTVRANGVSIVVAGRVSEARVAEAAMRMAVAYFMAMGRLAPDIINAISISGTQQVQMHVKFVEVSRTRLRQMGFNAWYRRPGLDAAGGILSTGDHSLFPSPGITGYPPAFSAAGTPDASGSPPLSSLVGAPLPFFSSPINGTFQLAFAHAGNVPIMATLGILEQHGLSKTLTEPTIVAASGQAATFEVGGSFPVPSPSGNLGGGVQIQWKDYGALMTFTPTVMGHDQIDLTLDATVSALDRVNGVLLLGTQIPAITQRRAATSIRLHDNQSFAIAGLLTESEDSTISKVPILGDLPLIGALFRNVNANRKESELVVLVSIKLVRPVDQADLPPTPVEEEWVSPSDIELFLLGISERAHAPRESNRPSIRRGPTAAPAGAMGFSR